MPQLSYRTALSDAEVPVHSLQMAGSGFAAGQALAATASAGEATESLDLQADADGNIAAALQLQLTATQHAFDAAALVDGNWSDDASRWVVPLGPDASIVIEIVP